uniref:Protein kinase domain-containing protein n=1 Tax=viral metagenome TaxID=1070528 RepID=A0A6C0EZX8_9ZZZZ
MSKALIPVSKLSDDECNTLFQSITEKLKIENLKFFYPIYKKVIDDDNMSPEELRGIVLDSKFKCKQILTKLTESDDEDFDTEDEQDSSSDTEKGEEKDQCETNSDMIGGSNDNLDNSNELDAVLNKQCDIDDEYELEKSDDDMSDDSNNDDAEIEEAINNTYMATAIIEKTNKATGEKICKEETIHIKKSALLEPLKIMKDEYVIPSTIQNKNINDESLKNTMNKLNSYNNSGHVEALFLYLGNKLVESGKCPSFPYYYGCVNGDDSNYHHNITDEYDMVSRTKWFRDRVKTDFDLLIIENEDMEEYEKEMIENMENFDKPLNKSRSRKGSRCRSGSGSDSESGSGSDSDSESGSRSGSETGSETRSDIDELDLQNLDDNKEIKEIKEIKDIKDINVKCLDNAMATIEEPTEKSMVESSNDLETDLLECDIIKSVSMDFIKDMDAEDLEINILDDENCNICSNESCTDESCTDIQCGGSPLSNICNNLNSTVDIDEINEIDEIDEIDDVDVNDDNDNDFIEELSDIDKDNLSITDFDNNNSNLYYIKCDKMPVSLSLMEKLDNTLDNILDDDYNMSETEWFSVFFQVSFGLAVAQKYFSFVHNDLHSSNVMFKRTPLKYLYFQIANNYYRVPTFGKITKIIDFARGTFKFGDRWVFSDQFKEDGDASGQYDYPVDGSLKNCEFKPNPSFDLVRLGTTVIQRLDDLTAVREFVEQITLDDTGNSLCYDEDDFQLYIDIARNCHNAVPIDVMGRPEFEKFKINKAKIAKGQYIFKY